MRFLIALWVLKFTSWLISIVAKGRGTALPGTIALKIDPKFVSHIKNLDPEKTVFVTGTNGKSTTTRLINHVIKESGMKVVSNLAGANLLDGVSVALGKDCTMFGKLKSDVILLEVDERFLEYIIEQLPAKKLCVVNIQKDQVQRNGEPEYIRRKIAKSVNKDMTVFLNGNEPNALSLGELAGRCISFGVEENSRSFDKQDDFFSVTMPCPVCHDAIKFNKYNIDNVGPFKCTGCGFGTGDIDYIAENIDFDAKTFSCNGDTYTFNYNTPHFLYCFIATLAIARELGISVEVIQKAFANYTVKSNRLDTVHVAGMDIKYLGIKQENPETVQSAINVIANDPNEKVLVLGFYELADFAPHYTNTFYSFDCTFLKLIKSNISKCICPADFVAYDEGMRVLYDGLGADKLIILHTSNEADIFNEISKCECKNIYFITWLHKFDRIIQYAEKHE
ncbi:MAG: DUF1727 domain-containing protein [Clostridiales bacterium]|nr:DUF1727 domain-containing protein [Candidatus Crickella caballi]